MNKYELKKELASYSDNFKLTIEVETCEFITLQDMVHTEVIGVLFYCEWMPESERITILWDDFEEYLESIGLTCNRYDYEYLYDTEINRHVKEFFNDYLPKI